MDRDLNLATKRMVYQACVLSVLFMDQNVGHSLKDTPDDWMHSITGVSEVF